MSAPRCAACHKVAAYALLVPSDVHCRRVDFVCNRCDRSGYRVALSDLASTLAHLGAVRIKRKGGTLLAQALLDAGIDQRAREEAEARAV